MSKNTLTTKAIEEVLRAKQGMISDTAKALGMSVRGVYDRIEKSEHLQKVKMEIREATLDFAESKLFDLVRMGNLGAICFLLKCQGRHRGWIERQEITGADGEPLNPKRIELVFIRGQDDEQRKLDSVDTGTKRIEEGGK